MPRLPLSAYDDPLISHGFLVLLKSSNHIAITRPRSQMFQEPVEGSAEYHDIRDIISNDPVAYESDCATGMIILLRSGSDSTL